MSNSVDISTPSGPGMGRGNDKRQQILNQLLIEMRTASMRHEVITLAAGNLPAVFPQRSSAWCRTYGVEMS